MALTGSPPAPMAPLIAIVGCDGSGKSTLAHDLCEEIGRIRPAATGYLGLGSGTIGLRIRGLPLLGPALERRLSSKAKKTRTAGERIPGLATALVVYGFSMLRRRRFDRVLALRRAGVVVITDRYPQVEVSGFHDGPGLSAAASGSAAVARLALSERRMYEDMASYRPSLVLRLDVDLATAHARKPDHDPALLQLKIDATPRLTFNGAPLIAIDSRQPYAAVREQALAAVRPVLAAA